MAQPSSEQMQIFWMGCLLITRTDSAGCMPDHLSAQVVELVALTNACILGNSCTAVNYMYSQYAFSVGHDFGNTVFGGDMPF